MDVSRRSFLRGALTLAATAVIVPKIDIVLARSIPRIVGDGVHDDTEGLNALFSGADFECEGSLVGRAGDGIWLRGGTFRVNAPVRLVGLEGTVISDSKFIADSADYPVIEMRECGYTVLRNIIVSRTRHIARVYTTMGSG